MGKHKKFIKSEKSKVKLKAAKLPKGLNLTKTEFKVKKIVIREQLREETFHEDGKKKHNIKEILSRLRHHNLSFRMEGLRNLKDFITSSKLDEFLHDLVQAISTLCLDIESSVRRESFRVLSLLLTNINLIAIEPFFHIISSYLRCAMTHIQQNIQEDSLLLLDVLLIYTPKLITLNSDKIFSNFLDMISKLRTDLKPGRTLTVNINNKITTMKWRSKILDRLQKMLQLIKLNVTSKNINYETKNIKYNFIENEPQHYPIFIGNNTISSDVDKIFNKSMYKNEIKDFDEGEKFRRYVTNLLPLLLESWLEVKPNLTDLDSFKSLQLLTVETAETLQLILYILNDLWDLISNWEEKVNRGKYLTSWFSKEFVNDFKIHIFNYFPFQQSKKNNIGNEKPNKKELNVQIDNFCIKQNLTIVYLYCNFCQSKIKNDKENSYKVLSYVKTTLINLKKVSLECSDILEKTLESILYKNGNIFLNVHENEIKEIMKIVIEKFQTNKFNKNVKSKILKLLCDIVLSDELHMKYGNDIFENWLPTLPEKLKYSSISEHSLKTLSNLGKQKNMIFLNALKKSVNSVIDNIELIEVTNAENSFEGRKQIMNLFFWINDWDNNEQKYLVNKINKKIKDKNIINYFTFIVTAHSG